MTSEYKTLRELDVQPGDMVQSIAGRIETVSNTFIYSCLMESGNTWMRENPMWRIVSRASDAAKTYTPGERQAVAEYPRASVSPDHSWESVPQGRIDMSKVGQTNMYLADKVFPTKDAQPKLLRDMTDAELGALVRADNEGKVIELFCDGGWIKCNMPAFIDSCAYRVRPEPKRETVTLYPWGYVNDKFPEGHSITFDLIDGKPDCDSIKMEEL